MADSDKIADGLEQNASGRRSRKIWLVPILAVAFVLVLLGAVFLMEVSEDRHMSFVSRIRSWVPPALGTRGQGSRVVFGTCMSGLAKALAVYANDTEEGILPPADKWCDLLVGYDYVSTKQFICRKTDAIEGESCVAINKNAAGKMLDDLPGDMVLLFETDFGKTRSRRKGLLKNRAYHQTLPSDTPDKKVYKDRWNQAGGLEIVDTRHHKGYVNVAFVNASVRIIKKADLPKLRWTADANDK